MTAEMDDVRARIKKLERELGSLRMKVRSLEGGRREDLPALAKLEGVWRGAGFSEEEIEAAEVRVRDVE